MSRNDIRWTDAALANGRIPNQLAGGSRSAAIEIFSEQTLFLDRLSRLDFRASKILNTARVRVQINFDAYNLLNADTVRSVTETFGSRFLQPRTIIDPRLFQVGGSLSF